MKVIDFEIGQVKTKQANKGMHLITSSSVFTALCLCMLAKESEKMFAKHNIPNEHEYSLLKSIPVKFVRKQIN